MATIDRDVEFLLVPRAMNGEADRLATRATSIDQPEWIIDRTNCASEREDDVLVGFQKELADDVRHACNLIATRQVLPKDCYEPVGVERS